MAHRNLATDRLDEQAEDVRKTTDPLLGIRRSTSKDELPSKRFKQNDLCDVCKGIRVFYYNKAAYNDHSGTIQQSDHSKDHTDTWNREVAKIAGDQKQACLEAGVVVNCSRSTSGYFRPCTDILLEVRWDCGAKITYSHAKGELESIHILDMGPAGYRAPIVLCDICTTPLTGFSFRCTHQTCSADECEVFDLCYKHYNEGCHYKDHQFQCIMQNTFTFDPQRNIVPLRSESKTFILVGLFPGAHVAKIKGKSRRGKLQKVVHKGGVSGVLKAGLVDVWHCTAEVAYEGEKELVYEDIGNKGKVDILALQPGDLGPVYADHFPTIASNNFYIIDEILNFYQSPKIQLHSGGYCYISQDHAALTICNASVKRIDSEEVWSSCQHLRVVDLMHNKLNTIPGELSQHKDSIVDIGLAFNHFKSIPLLLFEFSKLVHLNMIQNQLTVIPAKIGLLNNLRILLLDKNSITVLPDELGCLENLKVLELGNNLLTSLPQSVSKLHCLHRLELHHNHFKVFPSVLYSSDLHALKLLTLDNNRIQVIPDEAKRLISSLNQFTIHSNPIQIKDALLGPSDNNQLIDMISNNVSTSKRRGSLRVLVLGKSGSGKSSLVRALVDNSSYITPVDKEEVDHTVGINTYSYRFSKDGMVYELNLWDFAGEKCYAMMNQMFISPGSLVWLVYDMSKYAIGDKKCFEDNIGIWLRAVIARIGTPFVWIIGTHADKCPQGCAVRANVEEFLMNAFEHMRKPVFEKTAVLNVDVIKRSVKVFAISNAHDLNGHSDLHETIDDLPMQKEFSASFDELKLHWSSLEEYLMKLATQKISNVHSLKDKHLPIISMDEAFELLKENNLIQVKDDFKNFIQHLHAAGEILLFKGNIYLDIVWLIHLLREIFRSDLADQLKTVLGEFEAEDIVSNIKTTGIISRNVICKLWQFMGVADRQLSRTIEQLLFDFGLAFESKSSTSPDSLLFPWLLIDSVNPRVTLSNIALTLQLKGDNILLVHEVEFIPPSFFERLCCSVDVDFLNITRHHMSASFDHHSISVLLMPKDEDQYNGYIAFAVSDSRPNSSYSEMWCTIRTLKDALEQLVEEWKGIGPLQTWVACPVCIQSKVKNPHLFPFTTLKGRRCVTCIKCKEKIPVDRISPPQDTIQMLDNTLLNNIARHSIIQTHWKKLASLLTFKPADIDAIEKNFLKDGLYEQCYQMLLQWKKKTGHGATVHQLDIAIKGLDLGLNINELSL